MNIYQKTPNSKTTFKYTIDLNLLPNSAFK